MVITRWSARFALAALVLSAAPALTLSPAHAAPANTAPTAAPVAAAAKSWLSVKGPAGFSPNGDGRKDKARIKVKVKKRANVTLKVVRAGKVVRGPIKLGKHKAGSTIGWTWNGKNSKGKRVPDAWGNGPKSYQVKVAARSLKTGKRVVVRRGIAVDTRIKLPAGARLFSNHDTVYPRTAVTRDWIRFWMTDGAAVPWDATGTLLISTPKGRKLAEISSGEWNNDEPYMNPAQGYWNGRRADGRQLDGGSYSGDVAVRLRAEDYSGNVVQTPPITIHVSATPLVLKTVSVTVAAQQTNFVSYLPNCGPNSGNGCGETWPCGTVVPSTRADMPLGLSYRADECPAPNPNGGIGGIAYAKGDHSLDLPDDAVRGGAAVSVAMRGRPTVEGESDTASLWLEHAKVATSDVSPNETTTTASHSYDDRYVDWSGAPAWSVLTYYGDSYDVSEFDVTYKYLVLAD